MVNDQRRRVREERALQQLPRLDDRAVERSPIDLRIVSQEPVAGVQVERAGPLLGPVAVSAAQVLLDERGLVQEIARGERLRRETTTDLDRRLDRGGARAPDAALPRELASRQTGEPREPAVARQEPPRAVESALAPAARPEEQREELFGRERRRAGAGEPF